MPFIDPSLLLNEKKTLKRLLITSADDSNVVKTSFELALAFHGLGHNVLWVDGNLGEQNALNIPIFQDLERILLGQIPLTQAIQKIENISVLTGCSKHFLAELSDSHQYQFLQDLRDFYPNFDKVILAVDGKNPELQNKWMHEAEGIYLLFSTKNLLLNRTLTWLEKNSSQVKGLIGIGKNDQEVLLTYMRLKEILNDIPELILDIKKIAP